MRFSIRDLDTEFNQTEDDIKALQSVGQIIGEVLKKLDDERCPSGGLHAASGRQLSSSRLLSSARPVIVKASSGPRYVVSYRPQLPVDKVSLRRAHLLQPRAWP